MHPAIHRKLVATFVVVLACACNAAWSQPPVTALAFAPDDSSVVAGSQVGLELRSWPALQTISQHDIDIRNIHDLVFSPDGKHLLVVGGAASEYGEWKIAAWPSLEVVAERLAHADSIHSAAWLANDRFVTGAADNKVVLWQVDEASANEICQLEGHSRRVLCLESLPEMDLFISAGVDQVLRIWPSDFDDEKQRQPIRELDNHTGAVCDLALRPGQQALPLIASASVDKTIRLWQPTIGRLVKFARVPAEPTCLAWSRDGAVLAAGCEDGKLRIINPTTVQVEHTFPVNDGWIHSVASGPDGSFVVGGAAGQITRVAP